ncbi:Cof-type HAD-IIB family hydrolase [Paenibacillus lentus]|uniref:Cof-type HAD-IIB family hydrolase n=1 Tax=Paenibacillus lentus TaxID=1338368 RepID=A0A3Q8S7D3_9BACL|nr:Cof-type HAD-IIB family hydrolase [Paenibacillus lentus]AZK48888.1 Cof-type HAD-IIB family hydrolase [Paenibacillus lentus]
MIFFDIDGTLLDHHKRLPGSAKAAIQTLQRLGHEVALATGRSPFMLQQVADELGIDSYVGFNGQYVVMKGKLIYAKPFQDEELDELSRFAADRGHPLVHLNEESMRSSMIHHPYVEQCISSLEYPPPECDPDYFRGRSIYQTMLFCEEVEEQPYRDQFAGLRFVRWHPYSLDVLPGGGSKANGIAQLIRSMGFEPEEVYAFGDNLNDLEMLQYVGHGVAMGNAPDSVKEIARHVTTDVDQHGIVHGLRMVGLLP